MTEKIYIFGQCRNDESATCHIYEADGPMSPIGPLCIYGWNRSDGYRFSILRNVRTGKVCKICEKRAEANLGFVEPLKHKTRWI